MTRKILFPFVCLFLLSGVAFADDYYDKGKAAYGSSQYEEAINWFRKSAEAAYDQGQYAYGLMLYANGQAPLKQKTEALKWFSLAGEQGNPLLVRQFQDGTVGSRMEPSVYPPGK